MSKVERQSLEAAIVKNPDELAAHCAYADYLMEQNDPKGEFIQTQLALEDPGKKKSEREALRKAEASLLKKHGNEWLGDVGRFLVGDWCGEDKPYQFRFARGWLDYVRILPVPEPVVASLAASPQSRLLRHLEVIYDMRYHPFEFDQFIEGPAKQARDEESVGEIYDAHPTFHLLNESPYLGNLRILKYGFSDDGDRPSYSTMVDPFGGCSAEEVIDLIKNCPRLEELYLNFSLNDVEKLFASPQLSSIRILQLFYGSTYSADSNPYPLGVLAKNRSLKSLNTLRLHPGRDTEIEIDDELLRSKYLPALEHLLVHGVTGGDEVADRIAKSGILKRLKTLDLAYGNITDEGARILAANPDLKKLETLNLSLNALTSKGIHALQSKGIQVVADDQHDVDERNYLYEIDQE